MLWLLSSILALWGVGGSGSGTPAADLLLYEDDSTSYLLADDDTYLTWQ